MVVGVFLLVAEDIWDFYLGPCKVALVYLLSQGPPCSSLHQTFHKMLIVAGTNEHLEGLLILKGYFYVVVVGAVNLP